MHIFHFKVSKQYCTHASGLYTYIILNAYTYFHYLPKNVCTLKKQSVGHNILLNCIMDSCWLSDHRLTIEWKYRTREKQREVYTRLYHICTFNLLSPPSLQRPLSDYSERYFGNFDQFLRLLQLHSLRLYYIPLCIDYPAKKLTSENFYFFFH